MSVLVFNEFKGTFEVSKAFYEMFKESVSSDEARYYMNHVYFDGPNHTFVATDGHKLMYHINEDINESFTGFYELVKIGKKYKLIPTDCDGQFPNWKRVVPDMDELRCLHIENESEFGLTGNLEKDSRTLCSIIIETGCYFNLEYFTKVLKHVPSFEIMRVFGVDNKAILIIIDKNTKYVIMPLGK